MKKIILISLMVLLTVLFTSANISADNGVEVDIIPEKPQSKGTIEITADIDKQDTTNVFVIIQECNANTGVCYQKENYSMSQIGKNIYSTSVKLSNEGATYLQYTIQVQTTEGWDSYNKNTKINYESSSSTNDDKNEGKTDTPGFEFLGLFISVIFISLILYNRRR